MAFLDEVMAEQERTTRQVDVGRLVLTVLAAVLYGIGWITRKVFVVLWLALTWSWAAVRLGWRDAAPKPPRKH